VRPAVDLSPRMFLSTHPNAGKKARGRSKDVAMSVLP